MDKLPIPTPNTRIGFHYFPDTLRYRDSDLKTWLPELIALGASWLTLTAPTGRAIPERFLRNLVEAGIEPILHFPFSLATPPQLVDLKLLLESYAKWGVHYVVLFDRPNARSAWSVSTWTQEDLVERFLDRFIPVAECALQAGLIPVFPPLEPGGNYWDTSFLRAALKSLQRRNQTALLERLVLSAYSWTGEHSLNWGAGGPERWPGARPYFTPDGEEDQRGLRIFDWYLAISRAVLGEALPILLFGAGCPWDPRQIPSTDELPANHARDILQITRLLNGETIEENELEENSPEPIPVEVLAANFWVLSTHSDSPFLSCAWFQPDGRRLPVVEDMRRWAESRVSRPKSGPRKNAGDGRPIHHYLLLPMYEWGVADWHLDIIRPYIKKYQPTVGFSITEAEFAGRVTVIGGPEQFSDDALNHLRSIGCLVERINGDGISIATLLAER